MLSTSVGTDSSHPREVIGTDGRDESVPTEVDRLRFIIVPLQENKRYKSGFVEEKRAIMQINK